MNLEKVNLIIYEVPATLVIRFPVLTILVPLWLIITSVAFFYLGKLILSSSIERKFCALTKNGVIVCFAFVPGPLVGGVIVAEGNFPW